MMWYTYTLSKKVNEMDKINGQVDLALAYDEIDKEIEQEAKKASEGKRKPKKGKRVSFMLLSCVILTTIGIYVGGMFYFSDRFFFNTQINGVDFSRQTTTDAREFVESKADAFYIVIIGEDGQTEKIYASEVNLRFEASETIENLLATQNPFAWPLSLINSQEIDAGFESSFDETLLNERVSNLDIVVNGQTPPVSAEVIIEDSEVVIVPQQYGNVVNVESLQTLLQESIAVLANEFNATQADIFIQPELTAESPEITDTVERVNHYLDAEITYLVGSEVVVDRTLIADWVTIEDGFNVQLDEAQVWTWLDEFISAVNTHGTTRELTTPLGRNVTVTGGYYGWIVARYLEFEALIGNIRNGDIIQREPIYSQRATTHGPQDWGDTFLQVDLSAQHMWAFIDGEMVFEAPVITGLPEGNRPTPQGVYFILEMLNPTVLIGATDPETGDPIYETPVQYWMRTTWAGHGFHDATWQEAAGNPFGGTTYRTHGSHGCTNLTLADASTLYNLIHLLMPVVVHY